MVLGGFWRIFQDFEGFLMVLEDLVDFGGFGRILEDLGWFWRIFEIL